MTDPLPSPHAVLNQPPPLAGVNTWDLDQPLREAVAREGGGWIADEASDLGALCGSAATLELGRQANAYDPVLHTHDRFGYRRDEVEYHPAYHALMRIGIERGIHSLPWSSDREGRHVARAALLMLRHQVDEGTSCPITMTFASIPSLRRQPDLAAAWEPRVLSNRYDPITAPPATKSGCTIGMAMTERQGGSDVRANTSRAERVDGSDHYAITGHKWFCSAPMSDAFLVLAQADEGLTCFLMPRILPDGTRNGLRFQRLKSKLGNRSNASSEVEFDAAVASRIGDEGRGVANIIEMVRHTRLDCVLGSAATLRRAVAEAIHHAMHRHTFGKRLIAQPLMRNVLADLALESEAATALAMRLARAFDEEQSGSEEAAAFSRIATPVAKYWVTKRAIVAVAEAVECLGGNGYVEDSGLPRLYRDVPVNAIWEGSGNIQCLDMLRAVGRHPEAVEALRNELLLARGGHRALDTFADDLIASLRATEPDPYCARRLVADVALALQASLLVRHAPPPVADAFCESRLVGGNHLFGGLASDTGVAIVLARALPSAE